MPQSREAGQLLCYEQATQGWTCEAGHTRITTDRELLVAADTELARLNTANSVMLAFADLLGQRMHACSGSSGVRRRYVVCRQHVSMADCWRSSAIKALKCSAGSLQASELMTVTYDISSWQLNALLVASRHLGAGSRKCPYRTCLLRADSSNYNDEERECGRYGSGVYSRACRSFRSVNNATEPVEVEVSMYVPNKYVCSPRGPRSHRSCATRRSYQQQQHQDAARELHWCIKRLQLQGVYGRKKGSVLAAPHACKSWSTGGAGAASLKDQKYCLFLHAPRVDVVSALVFVFDVNCGNTGYGTRLREVNGHGHNRRCFPLRLDPT